MKILVTGAAGFIGFHVSQSLLNRGFEVIGLDNLNDYYDVNLKTSRNKILKGHDNYRFYHQDICDFAGLQAVFDGNNIAKICHLAAQPGVRYSIINPFIYQRSNNEGFLNILECARKHGVRQFVYASSSSVYGSNQSVPFSVEDRADAPVSLYAATKKFNELAAHVYSHLYGINAIGLRFFTAYGPWGRPDMAYYLFTEAILKGEPIKVYNHGDMKRDFTYIDDIVSGVLAALDLDTNFEIFNLGNDRTVKLIDFIAVLEKELGKQAVKKFLPIEPGDVKETWADIGRARKRLGFDPKTTVEVGLPKFISWYKDYEAKLS